jgi:hypothetical protein
MWCVCYSYMSPRGIVPVGVTILGSSAMCVHCLVECTCSVLCCQVRLFLFMFLFQNCFHPIFRSSMSGICPPAAVSPSELPFLGQVLCACTALSNVPAAYFVARYIYSCSCSCSKIVSTPYAGAGRRHVGCMSSRGSGPIGVTILRTSAMCTHCLVECTCSVLCCQVHSFRSSLTVHGYTTSFGVYQGFTTQNLTTRTAD